MFRAPHVATFLSVVIHRGFLLLRFSLDLATLVPERHVEQEREFESILDVLSVIFVNSHLRQEQQGPLAWAPRQCRSPSEGPGWAVPHATRGTVTSPRSPSSLTFQDAFLESRQCHRARTEQ